MIQGVLQGEIGGKVGSYLTCIKYLSIKVEDFWVFSYSNFFHVS